MIDLAASRAVLLGTGTYRYLPQIQPAVNSLARVESLLTGELCGWPPTRVTSLLDRRLPGELPDQLVELFQDARDVALFYYVGHGQVDPSGTLCLGLVESRAEAVRRRTTSLPFDALRNALTLSPAATRIVILDCCYAGLAATGLQAADDVLDLVRGTGAYTIAAAGEFSTAWFETDAGLAAPQTYFTKYLADAIEDGNPEQGPDLTLDAIFHQVVEALARDAKPIPTSASTGHVTRLAFARNAAARPEGETADAARWAQAGPYRGLAAFERDQAELFYGREQLTARLVESLAGRLDRPGVQIVSGASGMGKSSVAHAGLLPALASGALSAKAADWPVEVITPSTDPCRDLADVLGGVDTDPTAAHLLVRELVGPDRRLVLVVDQFERVFTLPEDEGDLRQEFVAALHAIATRPCGPSGEPAALVVVVVRSDFLTACASHPELAEAVQDGLILVGPMSESELRRTITGPAQKAGLRLEPGLVDTILADLPRAPDGGFEAGALPLLSQAMRVTWENREGIWLTSRGYGRSGGVAHAVQTTAEATYAALTENEQAAARQVFHRMTKITKDGQAVRRPMPYVRDDSGQAQTVEVVEAFAAQRLVVVQHATAEIAHDVLLAAWSRLGDWLADDQVNRARYTELLDVAQEWADHDGDGSFLIGGTRLADLRSAEMHWRQHPDRYPALDDPARAFLNGSIRAQARRTRVRQTAFGVLATLFVLVLVAGSLAVVSARNADRQRTLAVSRSLVAKADAVRGSDPQLALLLGIAAARIRTSEQTRSSLVNTLLTDRYAGTLTGFPGSVDTVAFSPARDILAVAGNRAKLAGEGYVALWDLTRRGKPSRVATVTGRPRVSGSKIAFSPDGRLLATESGSGYTVGLWDVPTLKHLTETAATGPFSGPVGSKLASSVTTFAFAPDGRTLAAGYYDGRIVLWDLSGKAPAQLASTPRKSNDSATSVAFSPDGRVLAAGNDKAVRLWKVADQGHLSPLGKRLAARAPVVFSAHGHLIATHNKARTNNAFILWDVSDPAHPARVDSPLSGNNSSVAFSPSADRAVTGNYDGTAVVWDLADPSHPVQSGIPLVGHAGFVLSAAISPHGGLLATAGQDGTVKLWDVPGSAQPTMRAPPLTSALSAVFPPHGRTLVTGATTGAISVWDASTPARPLRRGPSLPGEYARLSPDGRTMAVYAADNSITLWDFSDLDHPVRRGPPLKNSGLPVAFSSDTRLLFTADPTSKTPNTQAMVWDISRPVAPVQRHPTMPDMSYGSTASAMSPDGRTLLTTDVFGIADTVTQWDLTPEVARPLGKRVGIASKDSSSIASMAFSTDSSMLAVGRVDGTVVLWDFTDPRRPVRLDQTLAGPREPNGTGGNWMASTVAVLAVAFSADKRTLAAAYKNKTVILWDLTDLSAPHQLGPPLDTPRHVALGAEFSPDGNTLAADGRSVTRSSDNIVTMWNLAGLNDLRRHPLARACAVTGRGLNKSEWSRYAAGLAYRDTCAPTS